MRRGTAGAVGAAVGLGAAGGVVPVGPSGLAFLLRFGLLGWSGPRAGAGGVLKVSFLLAPTRTGPCLFLVFFLVGL